MKIYEIGTGYTPIPAQMGAATEIVVEELCRSLNNIGENCEIIDIKASDRVDTDLPIIEVDVPKMFTKTDVSLGIMHKLKRVVYSLSLASKLKKIIKNSDDEIVLHFHNQYNLFFFLKFVPKHYKEKVKIVYTNHSYIWHGNWDEIKDTIKKKYFQEVECVKFSDKVFVLNENTKKNLVCNLGISSDKIVLIDNGVNIGTYYPISEDKLLGIRSKRKLEGKIVFTQVGSVCDRKNQLGSLELLLPLMMQDDRIVFCYAGGIISEEYQQSIKALAEDNNLQDRVIYCGELSPGAQLNEIYNVSDAMIFPSKAEGFSLVILEAMSACVPVFVNNNLQFKLADKCVRFCNNEDFLQKAYGVVLHNGDKENMRSSLRDSIIKDYSWDKIAQDYLAYIKEL